MSNYMKKRPRSALTKAKLGLGVASLAIAAMPSLAQADGFDLSEKLSVSGFIDMSMSYTDPDNASSTSSTGLDQFEIDFLFNFDEKLSAQVDLEYQDNGNGEEVHVEQAYFSYAVAEDLSFKAGRFLSYSGWETEDPTGLFQYSGTGYAKYFYGGYQQGMSLKYGNGSFDAALSLINDIGDLEGEGRNSKKPGAELMLAYYPTESWTIKAFYLTDEEASSGEQSRQINVWTSYVINGWTVALETNTSENSSAAVGSYGVDAEASGSLAMVNYAFDKFGVTVRYHEWDVEDASGAVVEDMTGITLSPSYAVSDNLLLVAEYRLDTNEITNEDTSNYALEALVTW